MDYGMYETAKVGLGVASDIYGAWQTGQQYEAQIDAKRQDMLQEIDRNKYSFEIQESAKDRADFGASVYTQSFLQSGSDKINAINKSLVDMNNQELLKQSLAYEQSLAVDEAVGNMMSRNAIDAMKAEARLRVAAAGSGTSGGTTQQATMEARSIEMFDNAVIMGRGNSEKLDINRRLQAEKMSNLNKKKYVASELATVMGADSAGAAHSAGWIKTYQGLNQSWKEGYISHDKAVIRDTRTWLDTFFGYVDIINDNNLDSEIAKSMGMDTKRVDETDAFVEKYYPTKTSGKNTGVLATSEVAPIR